MQLGLLGILSIDMRNNLVFPIILMIVFALSRIPGLLPSNFSAAYALLFCAGIYFPRKLAFTLPLATMLITDVFINLSYGVQPISGFMLGNYVCYVFLIMLGRWFSPKASLISLLGGGIFGALVFYLLTNTFSWLIDPEYQKTIFGWIQALTTGKPGWPQTWEFFRNTLLSGGLFTGIFAGSMKLSEALSEQDAKETETEKDTDQEAEPAPADTGETQA